MPFQGPMSINEESEFSTTSGCDLSSPNDSERGSSEDSESSITEDCKLECDCGVPAKRRVSRTSANPYRLFYNCQHYDRCNYFQWADELSQTGNKYLDELNLIRGECQRLQQKYYDILQEWRDDRAAWSREKTELQTEQSNVMSELDHIKKRIKLANEGDLMPPLDKLSNSADEAEDEIIKHMVLK